jgi:subtilase family serine protease
VARNYSVYLRVSSGETTNTSTRGGYIRITPSNTPKPDLVVTQFYTSPTALSSGSPITFRATVKNMGTAATPAGIVAHINFYVDGRVVSWANTFSSSIPPGSSFTVSANGGPTGSSKWIAWPGSHSVMIYVDGADRIIETDETNNKLIRNITVP